LKNSLRGLGQVTSASLKIHATDIDAVYLRYHSREFKIWLVRVLLRYTLRKGQWRTQKVFMGGFI